MTNKRKKLLFAGVTLILVVSVAYVGLFRLTASDCAPVEKYDGLTGSCYYDCTSDQDCAAKSQKIDSYFTGSQTKPVKKGEGQTAPVAPTISDNTKQLTKAFTGSDTNGTVYTVTQKLALVPKPSANDEQLWDLFSNVAGKTDVSKYIQSFEVFNDENNDSAASVWQSQTAGKWHVNVNAAYQDDKKDLIHTMVHEYGHIVSLNSSQVNSDVSGSCPNLTLDEGCANNNSYIKAFYDTFWRKYGDDVPSPDDSGDNTGEVADFYHQHETAFVSDYAATSYTEDWAESWAAFVTRATPNTRQEMDQKVQFFYHYPALISLRDRIRGQIAKSL